MKHDDILNFTLEWPNVQLKSKSQRPSQNSICSPESLQNVVFYSISLVCCTLLNYKIIERWIRNLTFVVPYQSKRKGEKDKGPRRKAKFWAGRFSAYFVITLIASCHAATSNMRTSLIISILTYSFHDWQCQSSPSFLKSKSILLPPVSISI